VKAKREFLAHFAVVVGDDVLRVRVDAAQAGDFYVDTGFLVDLPPGGLDRGLADAGAALPRISCPALVVMGTEDPDWADPRAEAEGIVAEMPAGLGRIAMIKGAGHYPHAQCPDEVAMLITSFFRESVLA
jgi:pimeloyl-ACP methyl ester carboxylesterase